MDTTHWLGTAVAAYSTTRGTAGTALPAVAAETAGGLFTLGGGAGQVNQESNGTIDVNVQLWKDNVVPVSDTAGYPKVTIKDGTGVGEINTNAGNVVGVDVLTGHTPQTGDAYAVANTRLPAALTAGGNIKADSLAWAGVATASMPNRLDSWRRHSRRVSRLSARR
jgi:hypothetical protein